ncbi:chemotaxis protein CheA [Allopseudospirillum japonicum]|uniref:chemotaxis protein CheA n=1 Tax=Allopseudospirillum japonicum TaxID=64971 RepID=UPI00115FBA52|nr:chemotaxis protein CheA [Allopseudospirillum japonicum]
MQERLLSDEVKAQGQAILARLQPTGNHLASKSPTQTTEAVTAAPQLTPAEPQAALWLLVLDFKADAFRNGMDPLSFIRYLSTLGEIQYLLVDEQAWPPAEAFDSESCYLKFYLGLYACTQVSVLEEVFEFAEDDCTLDIIPPYTDEAVYAQVLQHANPDLQAQLTELVTQASALPEAVITQTVLEENQETTPKPQTPITPASPPTKTSSPPKNTRENVSIRVDAQRLGYLINLVGELVIASAATKLMVRQHGINEADEAVATMESLVEEIRDHALQLRMVQIGDTFARFRRVVRDVSKELGKQIDLQISGGDTELDKTVVEKINDPLTHLIRNALDHGIEAPEIRRAAGKPEHGCVSLNAFHDSGHIVIQISDDGRGLDTQKIRAKAERLGLVSTDQHLSHQETLRLIFEAGLSTKEEATNLSGRGVGMDVVKRNIESLRGSVDLESEVGKGTKVSIHLPLTLAIIDGFMVGAGEEAYVLPLANVAECVELHQTSWHVQDRHYVNLRGEVLPYLSLRDFLQKETDRQQQQRRESLVVVRFGRKRAGLIVDALYGELQTVIKPIGKIFQKVHAISGATILGNGEIALILDVQGLIDLAYQEAQQTQGTSGRLYHA